MHNILELKNVSKHYHLKGGAFVADGDKKNLIRALQSVSCVLQRGETLGVVGESGSGKSTLMRLIVKAEDPTQGSILYYPPKSSAFNTNSNTVQDISLSKNMTAQTASTASASTRSSSGASTNSSSGSSLDEGRDLHEFSNYDTKLYHDQVKIVFQDPSRSLNPRLKVYDILLQSLWYSPSFQIHCTREKFSRSEKKTFALTRIYSTLKHLGIQKNMIQRYPTEFSGGQRQRIALARALIHRPHILICDEVSSSLDVATRASMVRLLKELQNEFGFSLLFISHDISLVAYISDTIIVLKNGQVVEHAPYLDIIQQPKSDYTKTLIARAVVD